MYQTITEKKIFCLVLSLLLIQSTEAQVSLQTGAAEQNFPLINFVDSKSGLSMGVSASYSSGNGLLVNELASNLGTGWTLNAGGLVSRIQMGQPDDQPEYKNDRLTGPESILRYPPGYLYNPNIGKGCPIGTNYFPVFKDENTLYKQKNDIAADLEQDRFLFSFNGRSGLFIIGRDMKVTTIGDSKMKIEFTTRNMSSEKIRTTIDQFIITTEDGIKYTFRTRVLNRLTRYKYSDYDQRNNKWIPKEGEKPSDAPYAVNKFMGYELPLTENPYVVSSWYLTEIENTNNSAKISFEYETKIQTVVASKYVSHQRDLNESGKVDGWNKNADRKKNGKRWFGILSDPANAYQYSSDVSKLEKLKPLATSITYVQSSVQAQRLVKINLPNSGFIQVRYNSNPRVDFKDDNAIDKIEYWLNGKLLRAYAFEYGYFFKKTIRAFTDPFTSFERNFARLCLLSMQKVGNGSDNAYEPPYKFDYYTGGDDKEMAEDNIVPPRNSLSQDHWGYFNGKVSGLSINEDHDFLSDGPNQYLKCALYNYHEPKENYARNGLLATVTYPTGGSIYYNYQQNKRSTPFGEALVGGVSVKGTYVSDNETSGTNINSTYTYANVNGKSSRWGYEKPSYTSLSLMVYDEKWGGKRYKFPGIEYPEMGVSSPSKSFDWGKFAINTAVSFAGQMALGAIFAGTSVVPILNAVMIAAAITMFVLKAIQEFEFHRFTLTNSNDMLGNPIGGLYSRVEVAVNSPNGYNGKTVYEFTDPKYYPILEPLYTWPYTQLQRTLSWAYGLLKKTTVLNKDNVPVSDSKNEYITYKEEIADANNLNCKCAGKEQFSKRSDEWDDDMGYIPFDKNSIKWKLSFVKPQAYFLKTGRTDLTSTTENSYTNGNLYYSNTVSILNDPALLLQRGKVIKKDVNSLVYQINYYAGDFDIPGALQTLKSRSAIHTPVVSETWLMKLTQKTPNSLPSFSLFLIDASITEYKEFTINGYKQVKPWKTWALKTKEPVPASVVGTHSRTVLIRKPEYYKQTGELFYDNDGDLVQSVTNNQPTSYVNDYTNRYVVASVVNASFDDIAYTSFEADGKGGWGFQSNPSNSGLTGQKSFAFASNAPSNKAITKSGLIPDKTYTVTFWKKNTTATDATVLVNDQPPQLLYSRDDGWKFYSLEVSGVMQVNIGNTSTSPANLDELRLYPKGALMSTVAYKEGIGKVTECDANNRLMYYEYDALGRLKTIRDQNNNIIKTYEYNYKQ